MAIWDIASISTKDFHIINLVKALSHKKEYFLSIGRPSILRKKIDGAIKICRQDKALIRLVETPKRTFQK